MVLLLVLLLVVVVLVTRFARIVRIANNLRESIRAPFGTHFLRITPLNSPFGPFPREIICEWIADRIANGEIDPYSRECRTYKNKGFLANRFARIDSRESKLFALRIAVQLRWWCACVRARAHMCVCVSLYSYARALACLFLGLLRLHFPWDLGTLLFEVADSNSLATWYQTMARVSCLCC